MSATHTGTQTEYPSVQVSIDDPFVSLPGTGSGFFNTANHQSTGGAVQLYDLLNPYAYSSVCFGTYSFDDDTLGYLTGSWSMGAIVPGQSGMLGSPHYGDQVPLWLEVSHHPLYFTRAKVEAEAKGRLEIRP